MRKPLIIFLLLFSLSDVYTEAQKLSSSFDIGPATNMEGHGGISAGFSHFDKLCLFFDYFGVADKDGFIYHELSPKFGIYAKEEFVYLSLSAGLALAFYPDRIKNNSPMNDKSPFAGIPIQARIDFLPKTLIGCGFKASYIPSLTDQYDAHQAFSFFISIRLSRNNEK